MSMIKAIHILTLCLFLSPNLFAQNNLEFLGKKTFGTAISDVWSYNAPDGSEYALVGVLNGFSIVDVTEPSTPTEVQFISGASIIWRDIKTFKDHAYVINESANGVLIVDLQFLPDSVQYVNYQKAGERTFNSAHNLYIDEFGFMYIVGHDIDPGGVLIYDLNDTPMEPELVGIYNRSYVHDVYVEDNIMYTSEGANFAITNVSDKSNMQTLGTQSTYGYTHNAWLSDSGNTLFTTDETAGTWVVAWDISNPEDIKELDKIQSSPGQNVIPHNTHVFNDYLVTSYYTDGVVIFDALDPSNLVEVANFDTAPSYSGGGFDGCWGTTPFANSGNILATDVSEGLYILKPTYKRAARLNGSVTNRDTGAPINKANVLLIEKGVFAETNTAGFYATGLGNGEDVKVEFSAIGYFSLDTVISLNNGITKTLNVSLTPKPSFSVTLNVIAGNDEALEDAQVLVTDGQSDYNLKTDNNGNVSIESIFEGEYEIFAGKWGYYTQNTIEQIDPSNTNIQVKLGEGYYDDFTFDYGWAIDEGQSATAGLWERGEPIGTTFQGRASNPGADLPEPEDFNDFCLMTGNGGGQAGVDDVDNGATIIESPEFEINYWNNSEVNPMLSYAIYFFNGGGQGNPPPTPNDFFKIYLVHGKIEILIDSISVSTTDWVNREIGIKDFITYDEIEQLKLKLVCADESPGHLVEAAFDRFELSYPLINNVTDFNLYSNNINVTTSANPFSDLIYFNFQPQNNTLLHNFNATIYNSVGLEIDNFELYNNSILWGNNVSTGMYHLIVTHKNELSTHLKFIKQ